MVRGKAKLTAVIAADSSGFQTGIAKANKSLGNLEKTSKSMARNMKLLGAAVLAAVGVIAVKAAKKIIKFGKELVILGQKSLSLKQSFKSLAEAAGASSKKILADMKKATRNTVKEMDLLAAANRMMLMGVDISIFDDVMEIARRTAKATGQDINYMVNSLADGLGRQSKMILDNLGIIIDVSEAYDWYAETLGKTSAQLTESEKRLGFQTYAMKVARENVEKLGEDTLTLTEIGAIFSTAWDKIKITIGEKLVGAINEASKAFGGWEKIIENVQGWIDDTLIPAIDAAFEWVGKFIDVFISEDWRIIKLSIDTLAEAFGGVEGEIKTAEGTAITFANTLKEGLIGAISFVLQLKLYMLIAGDILDTKLILPLSNFMLAIIPKGATESKKAWEDLVDGVKERNPELIKAIDETREQMEKFNKEVRDLEENPPIIEMQNNFDAMIRKFWGLDRTMEWIEEHPPTIKMKHNFDEILSKHGQIKETVKDISRSITYTYKGIPKMYQFGGIIPKTQTILAHRGEAVLTTEMQRNMLALLRRPRDISYSYPTSIIFQGSIREEEDIRKVAEELENLRILSSRSRGLK